MSNLGELKPGTLFLPRFELLCVPIFVLHLAGSSRAESAPKLGGFQEQLDWGHRPPPETYTYRTIALSPVPGQPCLKTGH